MEAHIRTSNHPSLWLEARGRVVQATNRAPASIAQARSLVVYGEDAVLRDNCATHLLLAPHYHVMREPNRCSVDVWGFSHGARCGGGRRSAACCLLTMLVGWLETEEQCCRVKLYFKCVYGGISPIACEAIAGLDGSWTLTVV